MKSYKLLSHTADVRLLVKASTLLELFSVALDGMNSILKKDVCEKGGKLHPEKKVAVSSIDITSLLIDFLSEILTLSYEEKAIFCQVEFGELEEERLAAKVYGKKVDGFDEDIKGVTYHEAEVKKNEKGDWETVIVFDI